MLYKIPNAFDSHCHFLATGQVALGLSLKNLKSAEDVQKLQIHPHHYQGSWLVGFGWDQNQWQKKEFPNFSVLDQYFPTQPVFFSRNDGHASWINSAGMNELKKNGYNFMTDPSGGKIERDKAGNSTGVLFDQAHINALLRLPKFEDHQNKQFILKSQSLFNRGGFTHVRDLSMTLATWQILSTLADKKELTVAIEGFITIENLADLPKALLDIQQMKKNPSSLLRIQGVKVFLDGSLGSKTAFLSQSYLDERSEKKSCGQLCWELEDVKKVLATTWENRLDFAIHTIGDEAAHQVVKMARSISAEGLLGRLHLEHVQILRPETIHMMKPLHITCHMQPCHWLSDQAWLKNVIPSDLLKLSFPWESLRKNKIQLQFGSDAPIEAPSLIQNSQALKKSASSGWPVLAADWKLFHSHHDKTWNPSYTEFTDEEIIQVHFNGETLL